MNLDIAYGQAPLNDVFAEIPGRDASGPEGDGRRPHGRMDLRRQRRHERLHRGAGDRAASAADAEAGGPSARSSWPAGTARSTGCSARPSGASSSRDLENGGRLHQHGRVAGRSSGRRRAVDRQADDRRHQDRVRSGRRERFTTTGAATQPRRPRPAGQRLGLHRPSTTSACRRWRWDLDPGRRVPLRLRRHPPDGGFLDPGYLGHQAASRTSGVPRCGSPTPTLCRSATPTTPRRWTATSRSCRRSKRRTRRGAGRPDAAARGAQVGGGVAALEARAAECWLDAGRPTAGPRAAEINRR